MRIPFLTSTASPVLPAALWVAGVVLFLSADSAAGPRTRVDFDVNDLRLQETAEGTAVEVRGLRSAQGEGQPALPFAERLLYVPQGFEVSAVRVVPQGETTVAEGVQIAAARSVLDPVSEAAALPVTLGRATGLDPAAPGRSLGGGNLGGFRVHSVALFPVRWDAPTGRLTFTTSFDVELELVPAAAGTDVVRQRTNPRADALFRQALLSQVANPGDVPSADTRRVDSSQERGFAPEELPSVDGSAVDMVIITTAGLEPVFQALADWKTKKGVPTVIRTVSWIDTNYPHGHDRPERIREFIRDAYEKWGTYLVLLGGDYELVKPRHAFNTFLKTAGTSIPTDQYFACLDGNWNADGDHLFGEGVTMTEAGDDADIFPDVFVGRAPVENAIEASTFLSKSFTYDRNPPVGYVEDHGGMAEVLFPPEWIYGNSPGDILLDGKVLVRDSLDSYIPAGWARSLRYQSDDDEDRVIALAELNYGHHLLSIVGHGDAFKFSAGNGVNPLVQIADTDALTNGDRLMFVLGVACDPNEIDLESQGESLMNNPNGGAIAVVASTRVDFPVVSTSHQAEFLRTAFDSRVTGFGAMTQLGRVPFAGLIAAEASSQRWTFFTKMLLGDPELRMWTEEPQDLVVSHVPSVALGAGPVTVTVTDGLAAPVPGALVCVSDGNGTYSRVLTDGSGQAVVPIASTQTGTADVVVTKAEFRPDEGSLTIAAPAGAHLAKVADSADDDGVGASSGNGDGVIDAAETIELSVTAFNGGGTTATGSAVTASIEAGSNATFDLLYGGVADPSKVFVGPDRVNPGAVPFTLDFASPSIDYIGRPLFTLSPDSASGAFGVPAADAGIFVWQDREGWHLQWGGGADSVTVSGTVTTDGRVRGALTLDMEDADAHTVLAGGDSLTFSGTTHGQDAADGLDFTLADDTMVTVTSAVAGLGSIAPSAQAVGTVVFDVASGARDGQVAYVDLSFTSSSGGPWSGEVPLVFAGPELEAYVFVVDDASGAPVSGDGDGVIEVGETIRLTPTVLNRGTGEAGSVNGTASAASGITFIDAADAYGSIASLAETSGGDGYVFTVNDGTGTTIDLTLTDSLGRNWMKAIDFLAPTVPDSAWFTSTSTTIEVSWTGPDSVGSADLAGYNVYRSATSGSGHTKQNFELLRSGARFVDEGLSLGSTFFYFVTAVDSSGNESSAGPEIVAWTTQVQVLGWPRYTTGFVYPGITMVDANRDGDAEIYVGSHDFSLHGWSADAALLSGFPLDTSFEIWGAAAAVDLDLDGNDELLFGSRDSRFYAVHHDGTPVFGANPWLVDLPGTGEGIRSATTAADIDGDGRLELLFGSDLGTLYAFHHDGTGVVDSTGLLFTAPPGDLTAGIWGTIAVTDLDNNGSTEIACASWNDSLYVIDSTGTVAPGFPRAATDDFRGGVVAGDLDDDGTLEVLAGNFDGGLYAFNHDGSDYLPGGVIATLPDKIAAGIALANVDGDPQLEIFVGCLDGKLYAYNHDGTSFLPGQGGLFADLPLGPSAADGISATPIVVDVDGDSDFEIFVGHRNRNFYGFHHDGSILVGMPIPTGDAIFSTAAAGDLDNDGDVDVAFASYDATVNVLDFAGASTLAAYEWATQGANNARTATYGDLGPAVGAPEVAGAGAVVFALEQNAPNPFGRGTTIRYVMPTRRPATLRVFNVSGRLVRTLINDTIPAGRNTVQWDGRDTRGRALSSGIYFFRLDDGERSLTRKGVLLR